MLFQFLNLLKQSGPQKWVFDELADIAQMRFRFAEEEDACEYALRLAADAPYYAPQHLLNGHYLYDDWQPDLVMLCSPARSYYTLILWLCCLFRTGSFWVTILLALRATLDLLILHKHDHRASGAAVP